MYEANDDGHAPPDGKRLHDHRQGGLKTLFNTTKFKALSVGKQYEVLTHICNLSTITQIIIIFFFFFQFPHTVILLTIMCCACVG